MYYSHPIQANFGVKPVSNSKPVYDNHGNQKQSISYFGFKAHTLSFFNVPVFTFVSPASHHDKNYAFPLLHKTIDLLNLHGFNLLADAAPMILLIFTTLYIWRVSLPLLFLLELLLRNL